jgi:membrane protein involved in colicin uptake
MVNPDALGQDTNQSSNTGPAFGVGRVADWESTVQKARDDAPKLAEESKKAREEALANQEELHDFQNKQTEELNKLQAKHAEEVAKLQTQTSSSKSKSKSDED